MNKLKLTKAVKDFVSSSQNENLTEQLEVAGYNEKEVPEIIAALRSEPQQTVVKEVIVGCKKFNLLELNETENEDGNQVYTECKTFNEYQNALGSLDATKLRDFIKVNAVGCFRTKINSKGDKVLALVGIKAIKDKPLHITRITVQAAQRLNAQIWNTNNLPECSIYYLVESLINY